METLKNFIVGLTVAILGFIALSVGAILWPFVLGIGSLVLFAGCVVLVIALGFYLVVLVGHVVRKGFKTKE